MTPILANPPLLSESEELSPSTPSIGLIGLGAVGAALSLALAAAGNHVTAVYSPNLNASQRLSEQLESATVTGSAQEVVDLCDVVLLTVSDGAIETLAASLGWRPGQIAVHCSGALGTVALAAAQRQGATAVALHPLCTLPREGSAPIPIGTRFAFTGPDEALGFFNSLVAGLGGVLIDVPEEARPLYHAAAVMACNYTVALAAVAVSLLGSLGLTRQEGLAALLPLLHGTLSNLERAGLPDALTGPVVRGDLGTVEAHRRALRDTEFLELYDVLARATAGLALQREELSNEVRQTLLEFESRGSG